MAEWYVRRGTEESGPITQQEFELLCAHLQRTDLLRRSDCDEWTPVHVAIIAATISTLDGSEVDNPRTPRSLVNALIERDLAKRGISPADRDQYQYARIIEGLMIAAVCEIGSHSNWEDALRRRYRQVVSMLEAFMKACRVDVLEDDTTTGTRDRLAVIWRHRDLQHEVEEAAIGRGQLPHLDVETLSEVARDYLRRGARCCEFEWLLVDALAAAEIYGVADDINRRTCVVPRGWSRRRTTEGTELARLRSLLPKMITAYAALSSIETGPASCKMILETVANDGAGWDPMMLGILKLLVAPSCQ
jgi:hypothetical protein